MSNQKTLFSCGASRGGTTFITRVLSINEDLSVASDPFLPIFKLFRAKVAEVKKYDAFNVSAPMHDYFIDPEKRRFLDELMNVDLGLDTKSVNIDELKNVLIQRMDLAAKELIPHVNFLTGSTFTEIFQSAFEILEKAYGLSVGQSCGFNDNWVSEFMFPFANSFEEMKFLAIYRDPRASFASISKLREKSPELCPYILSYLRSWRKHIAMMVKTSHVNNISSRIYRLCYEDFVKSPIDQTKDLCQFLEIKFDEKMLDTENFRPISGKEWKTYSHHKNVPQSGIYTDSIDKWKTILSEDIIKLIEFVCYPELIYLGYEVSQPPVLTDSIITACYKESEIAKGWRFDHGSASSELEKENKRNKMFLEGESLNAQDYFIFEDVFQDYLKSLT
tara:strand:+ start:42150 stop:43319 length:1170 start_codon:yes stop_codon:yes gene_type:complete